MNFRYAKFSILVACASVSSGCEDHAVQAQASAPTEQQLDHYIESVLAEQDIPGMSVGIFKGGEVLIAKGYGFANLELGIRTSAASLFGLGSISKQFTATAVMTMVEEGAIALDARVSELIPDLPHSWSEVTVRHLLTHTSGIKEEVWEGGIYEFDQREHDQFDVLRTAFGPLAFDSGERWVYSNVGYRLLGMLIEEVSRQSVWDFFAQRIFHPVGMKATRNSDPGAVIPNRAQGYGRSKSGSLILRAPVTASAAFTEGALLSSVANIALWDAELFEPKILSRDGLAQMWMPVILNDGTKHPYGFGWDLRLVNGKVAVSHGGGLPGFRTHIVRFMDSQLTVVVLTNCDCTRNLESVVKEIATFYDD